MLILAFLIFNAQSLLTFINVDFYTSDWWSPVLYLELVDENQNLVETEKNLLIEISPLSSFFVYPSTKFIGSIYLEFSCILDSYFYIKLTCDGCESYTTGTAYNHLSKNDFIEITPSTIITNLGKEISIWYNNYFETPFSTIFLITKEKFDYSIIPNSLSSGFLYLSFFTVGKKKLIIYFDDFTSTDAGGIVLQIEESNKYYSTFFAVDYPITFLDPLDFYLLVYSDDTYTTFAIISCYITVSLNPVGSLSGTTTQWMDEGFSEFTNLYITTLGSYRIFFTGSCIDSFEASNSITVIGVDSIVLSANTVYTKIDETIIVTVGIFDNLNSVFTHETLVTLKSSSLEMIGTTSQTTSSGSATFTLAFSINGQTSLSAFTVYDLDSITVNSLDIYILNSMCLEWNQDLCTKCVDLANVVNGKCVCNNLSVQIEMHCEYIDEYVNSGNKRVLACNNIFTNSDVIGYYNEDCKSINIKFSSNVVQSSELGCSKYVILPDYLNQLFIDCLWISPATMLLIFGAVLDGKEFIIKLDASLTPEEEKCNEYIESLAIVVAALVNSYPIINLTGPVSVNLCDIDIIIIENSKDNSDYIYKWTVIPSSSDLIIYLTSISDYILTIPRNYVQEGNIQIVCFATSLTFSTSSSQTFSIEITNNQYLTVGFSIQDNSVFLVSENISIQGFIESSCLTDSITTYNWEYLSNISLDFGLILTNSQDPSILKIPEYSLIEGNTYSFKLTIIMEPTSVSGSKSINIIIGSNTLIMTLDKTSGIINKSQDLIVTAFAIDPDSPDSVITYKWKCYEGSSQCLNSNKVLLEFVDNDPQLFVSKESLREGATYSFTVTASNSNKLSEETVIFYVEATDIVLTLDKASGNINISQDLIVTAYATDSILPDSVIVYKWECYEENSQCLNSNKVLLEFDSNNATLFVSKEDLREGATYSFTVTASYYGKSSEETVVFFVEFYDLVLTIDKENGTIYKNQDLVVTAKAYYPVSSASIIQFLWECHEVDSLCMGNYQNILSFNATNPTLTVLKEFLREGAYYIFNISAYTESKSISKSTEFYISLHNDLTIEYTENQASENLVFYAVTPDIANLKFNWSIDPKISKTFPMNYSYFSISRKSLKSNTDYNISLVGTFKPGDIIKSFYILTQPKTPNCSAPEVVFSQTKWLIKVRSCSSDNPNLLYEFGCSTKSNSELWFTPETYENSSYVLIPYTCQNATASICNELSCETVKNSIPKGNRIHKDIISEFNSDISENITIPNAALYYSSMITTQDQWNIIFLELNNFFRSQTPTKGTVNMFISSLNSMILQISLISSENANLTLMLIDYSISTYTGMLSQSDILVISNWIGKLTSILDINDLSQALSSAISLYFETALPGSDPLIQDSEITVYAARVLADSLPGLNISVGDNSLKIPNRIILDHITVYDIEYIVYPPTQSTVIFEVSFYASGTYANKTLTLSTPKSTVLGSGIIYTTVGGNFSSNKIYECAYLQADKTWKISVCKVTESKNGKAQMGLTHQSTFKVYEINSSGSCEVGAGPIAITCAWMLIAIFVTVGFHVIDKNQDESIRHINKYTNYPLTSIFIRQPNGKRKSSVIYFFSTQIILMCLIGILILSFETPLEKTDKKYGTFLSRNVDPGAAAWGLTQIIAFPAFYFAFNQFASAKKALISKYATISLASICFIGIVLMTVFYCKEYTFYWIINYFIFLLLFSYF
ncbi:hypothetical protein SteCoe_35847 [Stentor coeruleus]|uniref:GPS domain-containing protein n=1 Tax=Stentor coeruleus TaxID=5963 RepID=A0A1R2ARC9_9CILI|nr:hypothetical protein SteCoe_35847 [Stentor coeruleus]